MTPSSVSDVSVTVPRASIVTILGPNGAGKSTLLNAVMGILPAQGSVTFQERDLRGVSILLVEQNARAALRIADYGYVLENGRVVLEGEPASLQADRRIIESYLGLRPAVPA
jgi:ABC-type branched-subunit amino acid transport system ATPase component